MNTNTLRNRSEIPDEYKWDIENMYSNVEDVNADLDYAMSKSEELKTMKGRILENGNTLLASIELYLDGIRHLEKALVFAHMKRDEDNADAFYTELNDRCSSFSSHFMANVSFLIPEILSSDAEVVRSYISEVPGLKTYKFMLEQLLARKEHTLSDEQEHIIASLSEVFDAPDEIFSVLNDVDMTFGEVTDESGNKVPVTHGNFTMLLESENRDVRRDTYYSLYEVYKKHNNTIATAYNYNVKQSVILSRLRHYDSVLHSALSSDRIPLSVYDNLIKAVHDNLPHVHKYYRLRKRVLNIDDMRMYDVYKPLCKPEGMSFTFDEAVELCLKALEPLGEEYTTILRKGLTEEHWVDIYENKNKTSGAYSFGSYDSYPYILMNFHGELRDVFTLIHESGHSMHSYFTRHTQPYVYGSHSIFTAEVASTVNETLLIRYLLNNVESTELKKYLINFYIDEFKSTVIRQTMFAEFEKFAHDTVENGGTLTAELLNSRYDELNRAYFGDALGEDDMIQYEWSRIPHFYRDYYVYQYATGYSAANAIANRILNEGQKAVDDYLRFLSSGDSDYPIELLKIAGVDMSTTEPVASALSTFAEMIDELDEMMK